MLIRHECAAKASLRICVIQTNVLICRRSGVILKGMLCVCLWQGKSVTQLEKCCRRIEATRSLRDKKLCGCSSAYVTKVVPIQSSFFLYLEPWLHVTYFFVGGWVGERWVRLERELVIDINEIRADKGMAPMVATNAMLGLHYATREATRASNKTA